MKKIENIIFNPAKYKMKQGRFYSGNVVALREMEDKLIYLSVEDTRDLTYFDMTDSEIREFYRTGTIEKWNK